MPTIAGSPACVNSRLKLHRLNLRRRPTLQTLRPLVDHGSRRARCWRRVSAIEIRCLTSASPDPWRFPRMLHNPAAQPANHHRCSRPAQPAAISLRSTPRGARQRTHRSRGWRHSVLPVPCHLHCLPPGRHCRYPPSASPRGVPCWRWRPAQAATPLRIR
jgi:hypothetical protein